MSGTNVNNITGPVHTYAKYPAGTDVGLMIYNGLDQDYQSLNDPELRKIWLQELQVPFNPSNLPCGITVVGITLAPPAATNDVGTDHTVTATLADLLGNLQPDIAVAFTVVSGPNAGATGTCTTNADCTTDANGEISFTYIGNEVGIDNIQACFINEAGEEICSQMVTKEWVIVPVTKGRMTGGGSVFTTADVRVTHGFELYCDASQGPNNLEINSEGNRFHLDELTKVTCFDNPSISPNPPAAGFDTYQGSGTGSYNGVAGATATWTFTDQGEPGKNDTTAFTITDVDGNVVLNVPVNNLKKGNHQAHKANKADKSNK